MSTPALSPHSRLTQLLLNNVIRGDNCTFHINLGKTTFVDQFTNCLQIWISINKGKFN